MGEESKVIIVCTDRGAHHSRELDALHLRGDLDRARLLGMAALADQRGDAAGAARARHSAEQWGGGLIRLGHRVGADGKREGLAGASDAHTEDRTLPWRWRCPTCGRDVQLRDARVEQMVRGAVAAGDAHVDVSYLPGSISK